MTDDPKPEQIMPYPRPETDPNEDVRKPPPLKPPPPDDDHASEPDKDG